MRVLHLDSGREMRGGQWQVLSLVEGLGVGHTLMAAADGPLMRQARARAIDVLPLSLVALAKAARSADILHAHDARCHTLSAISSAKPLVVSRRVAFPIGRSMASRWKYARASRYLAVSKYVRGTLLDAAVPPEKIDVVYDGVPVPTELSNGSRVLAMATDDPMKGSDLIRAASAIADVPVEFSDNLQRDLPTAAVFVYITRSEGLGSAALLAMAHGVPVVASNVGGLPEIVVGGLTENEPRLIASTLHRVLASTHELRQKARQAVQERFTVERMVAETRAAYSSVVST